MNATARHWSKCSRTNIFEHKKQLTVSLLAFFNIVVSYGNV